MGILLSLITCALIPKDDISKISISAFSKVVVASISTNSLLGLVSVPTFCEKISSPSFELAYRIISSLEGDRIG